jgi:hypothetical protein
MIAKTLLAGQRNIKQDFFLKVIVIKSFEK